MRSSGDALADPPQLEQRGQRPGSPVALQMMRINSSAEVENPSGSPAFAARQRRQSVRRDVILDEGAHHFIPGQCRPGQ